MYYIYVLYSEKHLKSYVGFSSDVHRRLKEHNNKKSNYTAKFAPWILIHKEQYETLDEVIKREKYLKSSAGRRWMKKNIKWPRSSTG
ncbi:GIY-YIG nuclease family protein [Winogradskyella jejuensis]|uniref:GIY-YIG nuclease family protein n=1 Tax=Winogradskyella jejuensis TaxID=1089305 RepID=UPI0009344BED